MEVSRKDESVFGGAKGQAVHWTEKLVKKKHKLIQCLHPIINICLLARCPLFDVALEAGTRLYFCLSIFLYLNNWHTRHSLNSC